MIGVLPGEPRPRIQGLATAYWNHSHLNAYITGSAFTVLDGSGAIVETIESPDDDDKNDGDIKAAGNKKPLEAIALDEISGKIATCTSSQVRVYIPSLLKEDHVKWNLKSCFEIPQPNTEAACSLSWGGSEELVVGSCCLCLFSTSPRVLLSWSKELPSPAKLASISHDSAYIACISEYDRLPKIWRRLSYGTEDVRFDVSVLRHPEIVTSVRWRRPFQPEQDVDYLLYTLCLDDSVRIWTPMETADGRHWRLCGQIRLGDIFRGPRFVCIIDGREFRASVESVVKDRMADDLATDDIALDKLVAVANKNPEICLAMDSYGTMSLWALEKAGRDCASDASIFNIAESKSHPIDSIRGFFGCLDNHLLHIEAQSYCNRSDGTLHLLLHNFDGRIGIFVTNAADLLDPTINGRRLILKAVWSGHSSSIEKMVRNFSGRAIFSRSKCGKSIMWQHVSRSCDDPALFLARRSVIGADPNHILRVCVLRRGSFVVFLHEGLISLWDCRLSAASQLARCSFQIRGVPICLLLLPRPSSLEPTAAHIAMITSERHGIVWEVSLPNYEKDMKGVEGAGIQKFCFFELKDLDGLRCVLPVDPAGSPPLMSGFLDVFARDVAISYTRAGRVDFWTARVDYDRRGVDWLSTCCTDTGLVDISLGSGSTRKKAALVNSMRSQVTIWDIGSSRLEFQEDYEPQMSIRDLDWTSTPDGQSILAVGFQHRVVLLSQMRFDYLNKGPAWAPIRQIITQELTPHPIGDSTWLGDGHLVVGAGNQLFIYDRRAGNGELLITGIRLAHRQDGAWDLFEAVQRCNGPLAVFHPQFLSQCILAGKNSLVRLILVNLCRTLKEVVPGQSVDDYLGLNLESFYTASSVSQPITPARARNPISEPDGLVDHEEGTVFSESIATSIHEELTSIRIPQLSGHEQMQLADLVECIAFVEKHRRSLDENGARFLVFFRQHALRRGCASEMHLSWREINWAFHSNSQDILGDFVLRQTHGEMRWEHARESGLFMWLSDLPSLRSRFELVARSEYNKGDTKNPVDCSLFYLALRKKTVLQGLWRMANWHKEQAATQRLLANNFEEAKWRTTALKNAYALLSKRRFEYAAAFFLLADSLGDAVEVCLRQLGDLQLAITIARVYEGDGGPILRHLLEEEVLPMAARKGNRWLASWAFWMLGRKDMAVRALVMPVFGLLETPGSPDIKSRIFLTDDPALVVLYSQLRQQTLQTLRGASKVRPVVEWEFVLHSAKLYDRMGCDLLGLDLVRNWEFQRPVSVSFGEAVNPLKLLRRRSSLVVDDLPEVQRELQSMGSVRQSPLGSVGEAFREPDAESLLESFGL